VKQQVRLYGTLVGMIVLAFWLMGAGILDILFLPRFSGHPRVLSLPILLVPVADTALSVLSITPCVLSFGIGVAFLVATYRLWCRSKSGNLHAENRTEGRSREGADDEDPRSEFPRDRSDARFRA
jgi:hypothetical protein